MISRAPHVRAFMSFYSYIYIYINKKKTQSLLVLFLTQILSPIPIHNHRLDHRSAVTTTSTMLPPLPPKTRTTA
ncbi:hypothetical protein HanIR_Chr14g0709521 [Helianthus annuus]|nr:hypothetical protein HanIR_Chr14g0709521 [Helianthus annuus]